MKSDSAAISSPVFNDLRFATLNLLICPIEKVLKFRGSHFLPRAPAISNAQEFFRQSKAKTLSGGGGVGFGTPAIGFPTVAAALAWAADILD